MKIAVVTGAAQGLGLTTATLLGRLGFHVVLTDLQNLDTQLARLRADGLRVDGMSGDRFRGSVRSPIGTAA
jgi:NAD(P)-dependent dehydrogenase (short-subunit alcohol dehydrogenase family)